MSFCTRSSMCFLLVSVPRSPSRVLPNFSIRMASHTYKVQDRLAAEPGTAVYGLSVCGYRSTMSENEMHGQY